MKKTWKRIISLLMTVTMLGSIAAVYANAATASTVKTYNTYLSLGDSIASGFGLADYCNKLKGDNIILSQGDYYKSTGGKVSIPTRIKGSYTDLVAKAVGATKVYAYACPGFRSSEIRMLIDDSYDGDWVVKGKAITELSMGAYNYNDLMAMKPYYRAAVKQADLITIDVGMNDTWFSVVAAVMTVGYAINGDDVNEVLKNAFNYFGSWEAMEQAFGDAFKQIMTAPGLTALVVDAVRKFWMDFYINYTATIDAIYKLNPDVTVVSVGCYNSFKDWEVPIYIIPQVSCYIPMNSLKLGLKNSYDNYYYADVGDVDVIGKHFTMPLPGNLTLDDSGYNPHPTAAGHKYMYNQIIAALPVGKRSNTFVSGTYPTLTKVDGVWAYRKNGVIQSSYNGLGESEYGVYYVKRGKVEFDVNGIVTVDGKKYYVVKNKVQTGYTGMVNTSNTSYYVKGGVVQSDYTGIVTSNGTKYYVKNGVLQKDYTGIVGASSNSYYVKNGIVDTSYSGTVTTKTKVYTVQNGVVVSSKNR